MTDAPDIRILGGNASPEEIAAVTAVLSAALEELAESRGRVLPVRPSAWSLSQRPFRQPFTPANGQWRGFAG